MNAQTVQPLYPDSIPNSKPSPDEEKVEMRDGIQIISKISRPTLTIFLPSPKKATGAAVIICPGGGYWIIAGGHEGTDVAKVFTSMGVAAIVLKYRIPEDTTMIDRSIGPLQDAQQAIMTVRENASKWNINKDRVGIMGFSAGGHLAAMASTHYDRPVIANPLKTDLRPDFSILVYPVISFTDAFGHTGSREKLLGKNPSAEKINEYSNELNVTDSTPPAFLAHASDDDGVNPDNSIVFYQALLKHHVPAELHLYQSGGHGFGMNLKNREEKWMDRCKDWMNFNGWLKK